METIYIGKNEEDDLLINFDGKRYWFSVNGEMQNPVEIKKNVVHVPWGALIASWVMISIFLALIFS